MKNKWKILSRETVFENKWRLVEKFVVQTPAGLTEDFFLTNTGDVSVVFPVTKDNKVIINKQYHFYFKKRRIEICAGFIEQGNSLETAKKELLEETGYEAEEYIYLGAVDKERWQLGVAHYYLALGAKKVAEQSLEGTEDIEIELVDIDDFVSMMRNNEIENGISLVGCYKALDYLKKL
ncbi:MAG: NUDIX hydrolase [Candidatus Magasanikbacteria bacterium]